jgi:hypothetical protein
MIPETPHPTATRFQILCALIVVLFLFQMLAAVELNDQVFAGSAEVQDVITNGMLVSEMDIPL